MKLTTATRFPVETTADLFPVIVLGMGATPKQRMKNDTTPNFSPDGRPTYSTGAILMTEKVNRETGAIEIAPSKTDSVHVINPVTAELGTTYVAEGKVWVQPYTGANNRMAYSITVESLVEYDPLIHATDLVEEA